MNENDALASVLPCDMSLLALGINHKTAPVAIRERIAFAPQHMAQALHELASLPAVNEAAILSTCNRTEVYCGVEKPDLDTVSRWLGHYHELGWDEISPYLYRYPDRDAVRHVLRVASGLDSLVLGEPQILGQMKSAYKTAHEAGTIGRMLNRLFQHTFAVAKQIRTDTAIGVSAVSVAFAAVSLAKQIFGDLSRTTALLIGAGDTIELAARHLYEQRVGRLVVANRTVERAHGLAAQYAGYAIALAEVPAHLSEADMIISSTASPLPILGKGSVERALKKRKHKPMFMVDIAVPRDIEPEVANLKDVYLYTVDDLHDVIEENLRSRQEAAKQAEEIIDVQVMRFMEWVRSQDATNTIRTYRESATLMRDEVFAKALRLLEAGKDPTTTLHFLAHTLTNKLIHTPTVTLRQASSEGRHDLLNAARELFDLKEK